MRSQWGATGREDALSEAALILAYISQSQEKSWATCGETYVSCFSLHHRQSFLSADAVVHPAHCSLLEGAAVKDPAPLLWEARLKGTHVLCQEPHQSTLYVRRVHFHSWILTLSHKNEKTGPFILQLLRSKGPIHHVLPCRPTCSQLMLFFRSKSCGDEGYFGLPLYCCLYSRMSE